MNIESLFTKALKNSEKLGLLYGFLSDPIADGRGLGGAFPFIIDRVTRWKMPNLQDILNTFKAAGNPYSDGAKNALMLYLLGEALDFLGQSKYSKPAKDAAIGMAKGLGLAALVILPASFEGASTSSPSNYSSTASFNNGVSG